MMSQPKTLKASAGSLSQVSKTPGLHDHEGQSVQYGWDLCQVHGGHSRVKTVGADLQRQANGIWWAYWPWWSPLLMNILIISSRHFSIFHSITTANTKVKQRVLARFENWVVLAKKVIEVEFPSYSIMANLARATSLASKMKLGAAFFQEISPLIFLKLFPPQSSTPPCLAQERTYPQIFCSSCASFMPCLEVMGLWFLATTWS